VTYGVVEHAGRPTLGNLGDVDGRGDGVDDAHQQHEAADAPHEPEAAVHVHQVSDRDQAEPPEDQVERWSCPKRHTVSERCACVRVRVR